MKHTYLIIGLIWLVISVPNSFSKDSKGADISEKGLHLKENRFDPSFFVTVKDVQQRNKSNLLRERPILIDVRHSTLFESFKIPGSLNIPLYAVKTKTIFKNAAIVLLNDGDDNNSLMAECADLRQKGFNVSILYGGLNAWRRNKGRIDGDYFEQEKINKVTPLVWFSEQNNHNWICIDVSDTPSETIETFMPKAIHIPYSENHGGLKKKINSVLEIQQNNQLLSLLIFNETGKGYDAIEKTLTGLPHLFFPKDGLSGVTKFLEKQALIRNRDKTKTISTKKCSTCS